MRYIIQVYLDTITQRIRHKNNKPENRNFINRLAYIIK